jgi:hypothetical protein
MGILAALSRRGAKCPRPSNHLGEPYAGRGWYKARLSQSHQRGICGDPSRAAQSVAEAIFLRRRKSYGVWRKKFFSRPPPSALISGREEAGRYSFLRRYGISNFKRSARLRGSPIDRNHSRPCRDYQLLRRHREVRESCYRACPAGCPES